MKSQRTGKRFYSIKIIGIDRRGTSVKILSPMDGENPVPIKKDTRLVIHEQPKGSKPRSHTVVAGPDPNNPGQHYQYFDDKIKRWVLIVQQPDDRPIGFRSAVRVKAVFDVNLTVVESNRMYEARSKDISATGMLLSVDLDSEIAKDSKIVLNFQLPDLSSELPPIAGKVVRVIEDKEYSAYLPKRYNLGIEFDVSVDEITLYVLKKQGL